MADAPDNVTRLNPVQEMVERNRENGFQDLDPADRGIALQFVQSGYSYKEAAEELQMTPGQVKKAIRQPLVAAYVTALQDEDYSTGIVSKQFVTSSLMRIIPMLAGEEEVPMVDSDGEQVYRKKFFPGELRATLETLSKSTDFVKEKGHAAGGVNVQINFGDVLSPGEQPSVVIDQENGNGE